GNVPLLFLYRTFTPRRAPRAARPAIIVRGQRSRNMSSRLNLPRAATFVSLFVAFVTVAYAASGFGPDGRASISGRFKNSEIVASTSSRTAGAIDSLTWNGQQFINSYD